MTSAKLVVDGEEQPEPSGALFTVTGIGAKGFPGKKVKLEFPGEQFASNDV